MIHNDQGSAAFITTSSPKPPHVLAEPQSLATNSLNSEPDTALPTQSLLFELEIFLD